VKASKLHWKPHRHLTSWDNYLRRKLCLSSVRSAYRVSCSSTAWTGNGIAKRSIQALEPRSAYGIFLVASCLWFAP